jgi:hypothetical protein
MALVLFRGAAVLGTAFGVGFLSWALLWVAFFSLLAYAMVQGSHGDFDGGL